MRKRNKMVYHLFGNWEVSSCGICYQNKVKRATYLISENRLWEMNNDYNPQKPSVWAWPLHLMTKSWISLHDLKDLNEALLYAQEKFANLKPTKLNERTIWKKTLREQVKAFSSIMEPK